MGSRARARRPAERRGGPSHRRVLRHGAGVRRGAVRPPGHRDRRAWAGAAGGRRVGRRKGDEARSGGPADLRRRRSAGPLRHRLVRRGLDRLGPRPPGHQGARVPDPSHCRLRALGRHPHRARAKPFGIPLGGRWSGRGRGRAGLRVQCALRASAADRGVRGASRIGAAGPAWLPGLRRAPHRAQCARPRHRDPLRDEGGRSARGSSRPRERRGYAL